jgi:hypothetical protein
MAVRFLCQDRQKQLTGDARPPAFRLSTANLQLILSAAARLVKTENGE